MKRIIAAALALLGFPSIALAQGVVGAAAYVNPGLTASVVTVKTTPGELQFISCGNTNAAVEYVQVFDTTSAVTLGTTAPKVFLGIPASTTYTAALPVAMLRGIKIAATTTPTGSAAPTSPIPCSIGFN